MTPELGMLPSNTSESVWLQPEVELFSKGYFRRYNENTGNLRCFLALYSVIFCSFYLHFTIVPSRSRTELTVWMEIKAPSFVPAALGGASVEGLGALR